jgi:hypothetical protein
MEETKKTGILGTTLKQTFKQIKDSRIDAMLEDTETQYRRSIEDLGMKMRQCDRDLEDAILDVLPHNAIASIDPNKFDAVKLKESRIEMLLTKREISIRLGVLVTDYETLFGEYSDLAKKKQYLPADWQTQITKEA